MDQLLRSIKKSIHDFDLEIIVIDNASSDASAELVADRYPKVTLISNKKNRGFSAANNQGIRIARGAYILLLNPDTLLREDTLSKCIDFMDAQPEIGALGVKMIDGSGRFLPESKRGLPTPAVSFYKMTGLYKWFEKSPKINAYYQGHIAEDQSAEIEVLTGAFFMTRRNILIEIGGLDSDYFMYGEDIDLSYRIRKSGYKVYYFPETQIVHYKGESSKPMSLKRYLDFYKSMLMFSKKNLSHHWSFFKKVFIYTAIVLSAILAFFVRRLLHALPLLLEAVVIFGGILLIKASWASLMYQDIEYYPKLFSYFNAPLYTAIWVGILYLFGAYDKFPRYGRHLLAATIGLAIILMIYALLPEQYRSSRPIILLSYIWVLFSSFLIRNIWNKIAEGRWLSHHLPSNKYLVFGTKSEIERAQNLIADMSIKTDELHLLEYHPHDDPATQQFIVNQKIADLGVSDLLVCSKGLDFNFIIDLMDQIQQPVHFKILSENTDTLIESHSSKQRGAIYTMELHNNITRPLQRRLKRILDIMVCTGFILLLPLGLFLIWKSKRLNIKLFILVLLGMWTWVGYQPDDQERYKLPWLKPSVFYTDRGQAVDAHQQVLHRMNRSYARDYSVFKDMKILLDALFSGLF